MARISGFPEWLPEERSVELQIINRISRTFELHGFTNIETRSVEPIATLDSQGETSKEIYLLSRLGDREETTKERKRSLGLHFDLTVPLARYVAANAASLTFPFRRYQIQKVWRGERPQEGRFREFTQADIDIVGRDHLSSHHESEAAQVMLEALATLGVGAVHMQVNNRKLLQAVLEQAGVTQFEGTLRALDKLDKIGEGGVRDELIDLGLGENQVDLVLRVASITAASGEELRERLAELGVDPTALEPGLSELSELLQEVIPPEGTSLEASLRIARGLDYYTGTVYETFVVGRESFGSICSGGRYDDLATSGKTKFPGVGLSIGVTRLVSLLLSAGLGPEGSVSPTQVLVLVNDEESRADSNAVARALRNRGIAAEVSPTDQKFGRQIRYADRKKIPFVWFVGDGTSGSVKDIRSGEQVDADASVWMIPAPGDET